MNCLGLLPLNIYNFCDINMRKSLFRCIISSCFIPKYLFISSRSYLFFFNSSEWFSCGKNVLHATCKLSESQLIKKKSLKEGTDGGRLNGLGLKDLWDILISYPSSKGIDRRKMVFLGLKLHIAIVRGNKK